MRRRVLLLENYPPDQQRSMAQYSKLLQEIGQHPDWEILTWHPPVCLGRGRNTAAGLSKFFGYVDKYVLGPLALRRHLKLLKAQSRGPDLIHITDHSNAIYHRAARNLPCLITLHDLIAVRRALREFPIPPPSLTGRLQQQWILRALKQCCHFIFISEASRDDYARLSGKTPATSNGPVIYPAIAQPLTRLPSEEVRRRLQSVNLPSNAPCLYYHGGDAWYKNRDVALEIFISAQSHRSDLRMIISGTPLSPTQRERLRSANLLDAVHDLGPVSSSTLEALYNYASVFLFPSIVEGFGWPPVEAQACGCPVVASHNGSLREVLESSALTFAHDNVSGMTNAVLSILNNPSLAQQLRETGLANVTRFHKRAMLDACRHHYDQLCVASPQS